MTPEQIAQIVDDGFMEEVKAAAKLITDVLADNKVTLLVGGAACAMITDMIIAQNAEEAEARRTGSVH